MREFRAHHAEFTAAGVAVAGVTTDTIASCRAWVKRLHLPYPLLSDERREAGEAFRMLERIGVGEWKIEFFRRTTILIDAGGVIRAVWNEVKIRGHATEVLTAARALLPAD